MVSQMSVSRSLSISITIWSSAHGVRFQTAYAISQTRSPSSIGKECNISDDHRAAIRCVRWICEELFRVSVYNICASFQVFHLSHNYPFPSTLSKTGALVCGGGPFKRDGAPNCAASLHRSVACFRLIFCRALCNAMERVFRFTGSFSRLRS